MTETLRSFRFRARLARIAMDREVGARRPERQLLSRSQRDVGDADELALLWRGTIEASGVVRRADTTARRLFMLPARCEIHALLVDGTLGSDAGLLATLEVGISGRPFYFLDPHSVRLNDGRGFVVPRANNLGASLEPVTVMGRYRELGAASTRGGPWTITMLFSRF